MNILQSLSSNKTYCVTINKNQPIDDNKIIIDLWRKLIDLKVIPCGLAVRDVLRIEMRYCLYVIKLTYIIYCF